MEQTSLIDPERESMIKHIEGGTGFFSAIALFSIINMIIFLVGANIRFIIGLGITDLIAAIGMQSFQGNSTATIVVIIADLTIAAFFFACGVFLKKHVTWLPVIGAIVYIIDGALLFFIRDFLSLAFHAYALFFIIRGIAALVKYKNLGFAD